MIKESHKELCATLFLSNFLFRLKEFVFVVRNSKETNEHKPN